MTTWSQTYEDSPPESQDHGRGGQRIREMKADVREHLQVEHDVGDATVDTGYADGCRHNQGSARAFYGNTAPTQLLRPDNAGAAVGPSGFSAALGATDEGRLWIDERIATSPNLRYWDGTAWQGLQNQQTTNRKNLLLNGSMEVWQRGTAATAFTTGNYLADRWRVSRTAATADPTQQRSATPATMTGAMSRYCLRIIGNTDTTDVQVRQRIEAMYYPLYRNVVSVSCRIFYDDNNDGVASGTVLPRLILSTPNAGVDDYSGVITDVHTADAAAAVTNGQVTWTNIDTTGFANITNGLQFTIQFPTGSLNVNTESVYITDIQMELGVVVTAFEWHSLATELELCERYYTKSYSYAHPPASVTATTGGPSLLDHTNANAARHGIQWSFTTRMRAVPTVEEYSDVTGTANRWRDYGGGVDFVPSGPNGFSDRGITWVAANIGPFENIVGGHATADAEL